MFCPPRLWRLRAVFPVILALTFTLTLPAAFLSEGGDLDVSAKKGKSKSKTITRTFSSADPISIPIIGAADPFPLQLQVGGFKKGKIKDVNVVLRDLEHSFPDDIDVLLVAPGGKSAFIMSDVGVNNDLFEIGGATLTIDDEADEPLPDSSNLITGTFQPFNGDPELPSDEGSDDFPPPAPQPSGTPLSVFDGTNPNGEWQLFVNDDRSSDAGAFNEGWSLEITARVKKK